MKKVITISLLLCFSLITLRIYSQEKIYLSSDQLVNEGVELHNKGEYDKAIANYKNVSTCDPNYDRASYEMALSLYYINKNEEALAKCREALSNNYDRPFVYSLMGTILDESGKQNEGIEILTAAAKKWPYNQNILYNLAVCYLNTDRPVEAEALFIKSVLINPYHTRTHLGLARVNYTMGRITQSYLAYSMVLLLNPSVNNIAAFEEAISQKPKLKIQEYKYPYPKNERAEKWNEIKGLLQSELAFSNDFDYDYDYNYTTGRQSLMLFRKLTFEPADTSIYNRLYARLFVDIYQKTGYETYLNYILKNINNENVTKWSGKNKDKLDSFISWAQSFLDQGRLYGFSYKDEQEAKQTYHYNDNGNLISTGELSVKKGNAKNGTWLIVGDDGNLSEKGRYADNKAEGEWLVYWPDGSIKNRLNFVHDKLEGINKIFYPNGSLETQYDTKSGKKDGNYESYTHSGFLSVKNSYTEDLANGPGVYNNYGEGFKRAFSYSKGSIENLNTETWMNGNEKLHCTYHNNMVNGVYMTWYSNSSKESVRNYKNDTLVGKYYEYYPNNQKSKELEYDEKGTITGKIITYDRLGNITSEENEYKDGSLTGARTEFFPDGKIQRILRYQNDHLLEMTCFDDKGKQLYNAKDADSSIYLKSFFNDGIISYEGLLVKDNRQGKWKFYNPLGTLITESNYLNGNQEGIQRTYFGNGQVEKEYSYENNLILGLYKEYYINGHLRLQGNYDSLGLAGKWLYYHENDSLSSIMFYKKGKMAGRTFAFNPNGKLRFEEFFDNEGNSIRYKEYEDDGSITDMNYEYGSHTFEIKFPNGKLKDKKTFSDNVLDGLHEEFYPNGQLAAKTEISHNLINGLCKKWDYNGNTTYEVSYILGLADGDGKWYSDNNLEFEAHYEQNKIQGKATTYFNNGKKSRESMFVDDKRNGNSDYFSPDGIFMYRIRYVDNTMKAYSYLDKSGNMIPEVSVTDTTSKIITYYSNGKISAVIPLYRGLYHGKFTTYYPSGTVLHESINKFGESDGYEKTYYPDNKLWELTNYTSGNRHGLYELYYENGKKQKEGNYFTGNEEGEWKIYNNDGNIKETLIYRNGTIYDIKKS